MIPPDWLCEGCGFIVLASGREPSRCPACGWSSFKYIGYRGDYDAGMVRRLYCPHSRYLPESERAPSPMDALRASFNVPPQPSSPVQPTTPEPPMPVSPPAQAPPPVPQAPAPRATLPPPDDANGAGTEKRK